MKEVLETLIPEIESIYEHLHENGETSWNENKTTDYIVSILKKNGLGVTTFSDCPGAVGEWKRSKDEAVLTVGVRADMDALWQEVNGNYKANHSCGHDGHMTIALGTMLLLKKMNIDLPGNLKFIFQPAEEVGEGALKMLEKGVMEDVDFLYGVHLRPIEEVPHGKASSGIIHGASVTMEGKISGFDGHGARPHLSVNAIEVLSAIVEQLKGVHLNPLVPYSVKMTQASAGGQNSNIIPGSGTFHLDLRAQSNDAMEELISKVEHVIVKTGELYRVEIQFKLTERVYAAVISDKAEKMMAKAIQLAMGEEAYVHPIITPGGEDFHFYTKERPNIKATMLGLGCDLQPGLHHPYMNFKREALISGIEIMARTVIETFNKYGKNRK
ncbi:amidohydrolase [Bacillus sp. M6-12]|uniref:M20 peptidase aminoacylase family protein n=1 Tax=Bacillus sp. M6-12 TaxID=2054166 RepID=UPI000C7795E5|nr:M20 peptidase aminoacylase family protein [Bacillus sp. M6-12]PLS16180.1 amidohydrolase [Bacillus sp. M6-12]